MNPIFLCYLCAALAMGAAIALRHRQQPRTAALFDSLAAASVIGAAWLGTDFSPSFTMMFLTANLALCALGDLLWTCSGGPASGRRPLRWLSHLLTIAGVLLALPSIIVYAAGDDRLAACCLTAAIAACVLWLALRFFCQRRKIEPAPGIWAELWFALLAAVLALSCGVWSPALLPYGLGLLCIALSRLWTGARRQQIRCLLSWAGLLLASLFSALPALC